MKLIGFFLISFSLVFLFSCGSDSPTTDQSVYLPFNIAIFDYSESCYLLDSMYEKDYISFYGNGTSTIDVNRIEVWVYADSSTLGRRRAVCFTDIPPITPGSKYAVSPDSDGVVYTGYFVKLTPSDYILNRYAGYISLKYYTAVQGRDQIAVAYSIHDWGEPLQYGQFDEGWPPDSTLTLKLIRTRNQRSPRINPNHSRLWNRMLKNIYDIGVKNLRNDPLIFGDFRITKNNPGDSPLDYYYGDSLHPTWANNKNYMYLTGIDRCIGQTNDTITGSDGVFDFLPNKTIDLENGRIIFPYIKPFSDAMMDKGVPADSLGANDSVYYCPKSTLVGLDLRFYIVGKIRQ